jgi:osmotically-inducible protein OsmY
MKKYNLVILAATLITLSGCAPFFILGGSAKAGTTLTKEQTVGSSIDDVNIWSKIKAGFLRDHKEIPGVLTNVSVEVSEGRVLLTGNVESADDRLKVLRIAWEQNGVREVINEIKLTRSNPGFKQYAKDSWITTQAKTKLLADKTIRSINYTLETIDNVVYVLGVAKDQDELNLVISVIESIKGVDKVVTYVKISEKRIVDNSTNSNENRDFSKKEKFEEVKFKDDNKVEYIAPEEDEDDEIIDIGQDD